MVMMVMLIMPLIVMMMVVMVVVMVVVTDQNLNSVTLPTPRYSLADMASPPMSITLTHQNDGDDDFDDDIVSLL